MYVIVVVSFRGSKTSSNWFRDLNYFQVPYPEINGGYVHKGFYNAWNVTLKPYLMPNIEDLMLKYKGKSILVTGHSMGAAVAQIAALDIYKYAESIHNNGKVGLYTFGSPRWANSIMADYFKQSVAYHWRLVNRHDPIALHPYTFEGLKSSYAHTATQVWYKSDDPLNYTVCDGSGEDPNCSFRDNPTAYNDHLSYLNIHESCK